MNAWLDGVCGDPVALANGAPPGGVPVTRRVVEALLQSLRALAKQRRFLHWQPAFPGVWRSWQGVEPEGGFDAVIGNPPYVRQEHLAALKPVLKARYAAYDGVADLYIYFFEQALRLLRPGGRFAFTVTNKWLKAGYAAALRSVLAERSWVESVTDFGHARGFFPGTDVFPSVVCARRPLLAADAPEQAAVTVVPRDLVQMKALEAQVAELAFPMPRAVFTREPWVLEPPAVLALMEKLRQAGLPLRERVGANALYRGVLTGFNEAFVVDTPTRDALVAADGRSAEMMRPFLRGQDVDRWASDWPGLSLIVLRSSANYRWPWSDLTGEAAENCFRETFPAVHERFRPMREQMIAREDQGRFWWELRSCSYYTAFEQPKIIYQEIQYYPAYSLDTEGRYLNSKGFLIRSADAWLLTVLNSPLLWWFGWRHFARMKDEALTPQGYRLETLPIAPSDSRTASAAAEAVAALQTIRRERQATQLALRDWLRVTWDLPAPPGALLEPFNLTPDQFAQALRAALPARRRTLSAAAVAAIRAEHAATVVPMAAKLAEAARHEAALSAIVNRAYGLTPEDEALLWATAPPRMPIPSPHAPVPAP